jgi:hypothetical protein
MTKTAEEAARALYDAIKAGDFDAVRDGLAEDCVIEFYGPSIIPYAGIFRGKTNCMKFFDHVQNDVTIHEFTQDEFIANDKQVAVVGHLKLQAKSTGRTYDTEYAHIIDVRDGKWTRFRDFADTATVAHAFFDTETPPDR